MSSISKIATGIYGAGICVSSFCGIREQNLKLKKNYKYNTDNDNFDYAIVSFGGLMIGGFTGLWWPITLIGRASVMFSPTEEEKNAQNQNK